MRKNVIFVTVVRRIGAVAEADEIGIAEVNRSAFMKLAPVILP